MTEKRVIKLEKLIRFKMTQIEAGKLIPKDSGMGTLMINLKSMDEALFEKLIKEYKTILSDLKN